MRNNTQLLWPHPQFQQLLMSILCKHQNAIAAIEEKSSNCFIVPFAPDSSIWIEMKMWHKNNSTTTQAAQENSQFAPSLTIAMTHNNISIGRKQGSKKRPGKQLPFTNSSRTTLHANAIDYFLTR